MQLKRNQTQASNIYIGYITLAFAHVLLALGCVGLRWVALGENVRLSAKRE